MLKFGFFKVSLIIFLIDEIFVLKVWMLEGVMLVKL